MRKLVELIKENLVIEGDLQNTYFDILTAEIEGFETLEEIKDFIQDVNCSSGMIGGLIYYHQTEEIFKNNFNEIFELANEFKSQGIDLEFNANTLVWFTFETIVGDWYFQIEGLEE